jgi:UDP-N-acetylmuramyl pentapeptide synthase
MAEAYSILTQAKSRLAEISPAVICVIGGYGRSAAAALISQALAGPFKVCHAAMRCGDILDCAMKVIQAPEDATVLVCELESVSVSEMAEFVKNFPPAHIAITGAVNQEGSPGHGQSTLFSTLAGLAPRATLHYNRDDEALIAALGALNGIGLGVGTRSVGFTGGDVTIKESSNNLTAQGVPELCAVITADGKNLRCGSKIFGRQNARGMAFALSVALDLGVHAEEVCSGMAEARYSSDAGRICRTAGGGLMIDETRGANADSASRHIKDLIEFGVPGNIVKLAILGGMGDLGTDSRRWHDVTVSRACLLDGVYLIGKEWDGIVTEQASLRGRWEDVDYFMRDFDPAALEAAVTLVMDFGRYDISRIFLKAPLAGKDLP